MSRGNYYYARGWVGSKTSGWTHGEVGRLDALGDGIANSILLIALGAIIQTISAFMDVNILSSVLPLFSLVLGVAGVVVVLQVSEKGLLYVGGWTFISLLLFGYNIIGVTEFLIDLIPIGILVVYAVVKQKVSE